MAKWPSDRELQEIYRKGSEHHDFQYDPEAWVEMEKLLDKRKKRRLFILLFSGLGLALFLFFAMPTANNHKLESQQTESYNEKEEGLSSFSNETPIENPKSEISSIQNSETSNSNKSIIAINEESNDPQNPSDSALKEGALQNTSRSQAQTAEIQFPSSESNTQAIEQINSRTYSILNSTENSSIDSRNKDETPSSIATSLISGSSTFTEDKIKNESQSNSTITPHTSESIDNQSVYLENQKNRISISKLEILPFHNLKTINEIQFETPLTSALNDRVNRPFLLLQASAGIESSWTPNGEFSRLDYNLGLGANLMLHNNFGFGFGAHYVSDAYTAKKGDYKPPSGYWEGRGAPVWTSANCQILEFYYGFNYHFGDVFKNSLSTAIYLNSNLMLSEKYDYYYTEEGNNFSNSWAMDNGTLISGITFSSDYNFTVSRKWRLGIGPFLKIPVKGIGHGNIMLSSFGLRMTATLKP